MCQVLNVLIGLKTSLKSFVLTDILFKVMFSFVIKLRLLLNLKWVVMLVLIFMQHMVAQYTMAFLMLAFTNQQPLHSPPLSHLCCLLYITKLLNTPQPNDYITCYR
nr:ORF4b [Bat coronavirus]